MAIQYKPTKPKKEKPQKTPKAPKAEKPVKLGPAKAVKLDKPKKVKEPKAPKAPKPEKAMEFKPSKIEKAEQLKTGIKFKQPANKKVIIVAIALAVIAIVVALLVFVFLRDTDTEIKPDSLSIAVMPNKVTYFVGDEASFSGLKVAIKMTNDKEIIIDGSECEITGFDSSAPAENQTITVKARDLTATFNVTIKERPIITESTDMVGISIKSLPKTEYKVGDWMSVEGGVLLIEYDNGTTKEVEMTYDHVSGFNTAEAGTFELTVKYVEKGLIAITTYDITVTE